MRFRRAWCVVALATLCSCDALVLTYDGSGSTPVMSARITNNGSDQYSIAGTGGRVEARPLDSNTGSNLRVAFWPADAPVAADEQTCAVWAQQAGANVQQGAALHVVEGDAYAPSPSPRTYGWVRSGSSTSMRGARLRPGSGVQPRWSRAPALAPVCTHPSEACCRSRHGPIVNPNRRGVIRAMAVKLGSLWDGRPQGRRDGMSVICRQEAARSTRT